MKRQPLKPYDIKDYVEAAQAIDKKRMVNLLEPTQPIRRVLSIRHTSTGIRALIEHEGGNYWQTLNRKARLEVAQ